MSQTIFFDIDYTLINTDVIHSVLTDQKNWRTTNIPYSKCVYQEVPEVIKKLSSKYVLGILSESVIPDFQIAKLKNSNLLPFFQEKLLFIGPSKKTLVEQIKTLKLKNNPFFVDDRPDHLEIIKRVIPLAVTIRIKRGRYQDITIQNSGNFECKNFVELQAILNSEFKDFSTVPQI